MGAICRLSSCCVLVLVLLLSLPTDVCPKPQLVGFDQLQLHGHPDGKSQLDEKMHLCSNVNMGASRWRPPKWRGANLIPQPQIPSFRPRPPFATRPAGPQSTMPSPTSTSKPTPSTSPLPSPTPPVVFGPPWRTALGSWVRTTINGRPTYLRPSLHSTIPSTSVNVSTSTTTNSSTHTTINSTSITTATTTISTTSSTIGTSLPSVSLEPPQFIYDRDDPRMDPLALSYAEFLASLAACGYSADAIDAPGLYDTIVDSLLYEPDGFPFFSTKAELAMFLAQIYHESGGLLYTQELACTSPPYNATSPNPLCRSAYAYPELDVADHVYYGRGFMQLTWSYNYKAASLALFKDLRLLEQPELVAQAPWNWRTALWYWQANVQWIPAVQAGEFGASTMAINPMECRKDFKDQVLDDAAVLKIAAGLAMRPDVVQLRRAFQKRSYVPASCNRLSHPSKPIDWLARGHHPWANRNHHGRQPSVAPPSNVTRGVSDSYIYPRLSEEELLKQNRENAVSRFKCYSNIIHAWKLDDIISPNPYGCYPITD